MPESSIPFTGRFQRNVHVVHSVDTQCTLHVECIHNANGSERRQNNDDLRSIHSVLLALCIGLWIFILADWPRSAWRRRESDKAQHCSLTLTRGLDQDLIYRNFIVSQLRNSHSEPRYP